MGVQMRNLARFSAVLSTIVFLAGCATTVDVPLSHFQSPEVEGANKVRLSGGLVSQGSVVLTEDYTDSAPNSSPPRISIDEDLFVEGALGLGEKFEVGLRLPFEAYGKFQFMGTNSRESAPGDFSGAVFSSIGGYEEEQEGRNVFRTNARKVELEHFTWDIGTSVGYRFLPFALVYVSPFYNYTSYEGTYTVLSTPAVASPFKGNITGIGSSLGLEIGNEKARLMIEGSGSRIKSAGVRETVWGVGGIASLRF